jgi:hypothetical protein
MTLKTTLLAAAAVLSMVGAASAAPITGQMSLGGFAQAVGSTGMGSATGISFANASGSSVSGTSGVLTSFGASSGTFASVGACSSTTTGCGTIQNITSFATSAPISSFLSLTQNGITVSFDLSSITSVTHGSDATGGSVTFAATGLIHETGFDNTAGVFSLTAQGNNITSFSATTLAAAQAVPEPASMALLGGGLAAIGLIRRKKA